MSKKYIIRKDLKRRVVDDHGKLHFVYRIQATRDFSDVKKNDFGGCISRTGNLSQRGNAWIYDSSIVYEHAIVYGDAKVKNMSNVYGEVSVLGRAIVDCSILRDAAIVSGDAIVKNCILAKKACVDYDAENQRINE